MCCPTFNTPAVSMSPGPVFFTLASAVSMSPCPCLPVFFVVAQALSLSPSPCHPHGGTTSPRVFLVMVPAVSLSPCRCLPVSLSPCPCPCPPVLVIIFMMVALLRLASPRRSHYTDTFHIILCTMALVQY